MKKVLVLLAMAAMAATPALAAANSIVGSRHDLSSQNARAGINVSGSYDEICVYCHTPHGARIAGSPTNTLPLWNRSNVTFSSTDLYNSTSLNTLSKPSTVSAEVAQSDAPLCISCHDATNYSKALQNPPNSANSVALTFTGTFSANALLGTLTNDHPIGMDYVALQTAEGVNEFYDKATTGLPFYGDGQKYMWCSSCHDVHNPGYDASGSYAGTQFMNTTMVGSALCLKCHNK